MVTAPPRMIPIKKKKIEKIEKIEKENIDVDLKYAGEMFSSHNGSRVLCRLSEYVFIDIETNLTYNYGEIDYLTNMFIYDLSQVISSTHIYNIDEKIIEKILFEIRLEKSDFIMNKNEEINQLYLKIQKEERDAEERERVRLEDIRLKKERDSFVFVIEDGIIYNDNETFNLRELLLLQYTKGFDKLRICL